MLGFAPSPLVGFAAGSFTCSPSSHVLAPRCSTTVIGASIPAARRGRARSLLRCSLDPGSEQSSRRQLMTLATAGLLGTLASAAGAEDIAPKQKVGVIEKMKGKVTSKVSEAQSGGVAGVSVSVVKQTVLAKPGCRLPVLKPQRSPMNLCTAHPPDARRKRTLHLLPRPPEAPWTKRVRQVLYPIDTVKCRLQSRPLAEGESPWARRDLFKGLYSGHNPFGPLGSSSSHYERTLEIVLQESRDCFWITSISPAAFSSHGIYSLVSFRKPIPQQNRQLIVHS